MDNYRNFAKVTVSTGYDSAATSVALIAGDGLKLPTPPFNAVWWNSRDYSDPTDDPLKEIVRVTAIVGDVLTITRAQESTSATNKNTNGKVYKIIAGLTAKALNTDIPALFSGPQVSSGTVAPSANPGVSAAFYYRRDTSEIWIWNSDTSAWDGVIVN